MSERITGQMPFSIHCVEEKSYHYKGSTSFYVNTIARIMMENKKTWFIFSTNRITVGEFYKVLKDRLAELTKDFTESQKDEMKDMINEHRVDFFTREALEKIGDPLAFQSAAGVAFKYKVKYDYHFFERIIFVIEKDDIRHLSRIVENRGGYTPIDILLKMNCEKDNEPFSLKAVKNRIDPAFYKRYDHIFEDWDDIFEICEGRDANIYYYLNDCTQNLSINIRRVSCQEELTGKADYFYTAETWETQDEITEEMRKKNTIIDKIITTDSSFNPDI